MPLCDYSIAPSINYPDPQKWLYKPQQMLPVLTLLSFNQTCPLLSCVSFVFVLWNMEGMYMFLAASSALIIPFYDAMLSAFLTIMCTH